MFQSTKLDRRVVVERKAIARDPNFNSEIPAWVALASVWASLDDLLDIKLAGAEKVIDTQRILVRQTRVVIRYRSDVDTTMRIRLADRANRLLQIVSIAEVGRREGLDLMCENYSV